jgi:hypothetical protein
LFAPVFIIIVVPRYSNIVLWRVRATGREGGGGKGRIGIFRNVTVGKKLVNIIRATVSESDKKISIHMVVDRRIHRSCGLLETRKSHRTSNKSYSVHRVLVLLTFLRINSTEQGRPNKWKHKTIRDTNVSYSDTFMYKIYLILKNRHKWLYILC